MTQSLEIAVDFYRCEPCSRKQGVEVTELVRMMPRPAIVFGELVGDEWWCCPLCYEKKFPLRKPRRKAVERAAKPARKSRTAGGAFQVV